VKKICVVTAARSEYGVLKWLLQEIAADKEYTLQLVVTGGHLLARQGHTVDAIVLDGFTVDAVVDARLDLSSPSAVAASMGRMGEGLAPVFARLQPDLLIVLGDRYELLPVCSTAFVMRIPIAHISGGDVTEGAIDDGVRNAVTMLADYHFPGTEDAARNIERMRGSRNHVWAVGEPGLDAFRRMPLLARGELAADLGLDAAKRWCLMTYHAETKRGLDYNLDAVNNCIAALEAQSDLQTVMTYANADFGGAQINALLERAASAKPGLFKLVPSLGQLRYLSFMKQAALVLGNSSSGIIEAPSLGIPVVNVGARQQGRHLCRNIIQSGSSRDALAQAVSAALSRSPDTSDASYWGDGTTAQRIMQILHEIF
jgi:UDP-hydrolysing UDP-N-acetyl-D-glucosamine 2-epimerase